MRLTIAALLSALLVGCGSGTTPNKSAADLFQDLKSKDEALRITAAGALGKVGSGQVPDAVKALSEALKDTSPYVRQNAARSLGDLGSKAQDAVGLLQTTLKDTDDGVRFAAEEALKKIQGK